MNVAGALEGMGCMEGQVKAALSPTLRDADVAWSPGVVVAQLQSVQGSFRSYRGLLWVQRRVVQESGQKHRRPKGNKGAMKTGQLEDSKQCVDKVLDCTCWS